MGVCFYPLPSFEGGDALLATVPRDNGTNALDYPALLQALDGHPPCGLSATRATQTGKLQSFLKGEVPHCGKRG